MDDKQKLAISQSLHFLCRETKGHSDLAGGLTTAGFLKDKEKDEIMAVIYEQNRKIYTTLQTTKIPWKVLIEILESSDNFQVAKFLNFTLTELKKGGNVDENENMKVEALTKGNIQKYEGEIKEYMRGKTSLDLKELGVLHQQIKIQMERTLNEELKEFGSKVENGKYLIKFNNAVNNSFGTLMNEWSLGFLKNSNYTDSKGNSKDWRFGKDYREKKLDYTHKFGNDADVALIVGAGKFELRSCKMRLIIASPVFEEQFTKGDFKEMNRLIYITVPQYEPKLFKLFINTLPPVPDYTMDELVREYTQSVSEVLSLLVIRKKYGVNEPENSTEICLEPFLQKMGWFMRKKQFLDLSQDRLEILLSCDELPVDEMTLFENVKRWGEAQCAKAGVDKSGKNLRLKLGSCLYEIRFPLLSFQTFYHTIIPTNILGEGDALEITEYLNLKDEQKKRFNVSKFPFKTNERSTKYKVDSESLLLCDPVEDPPFLCTGQKCNLFLNFDSQVELHAIGFHGPLENDCYYQMDVTVQTFQNGKWIDYEGGQYREHVFAKRREIFYFEFDDPINLDIYQARTYTNQCKVTFSLKGPQLTSGGVKKLRSWQNFFVDSVNFEVYIETLHIAAIKLKRIVSIQMIEDA